jgi:hypothetical protein
MTESATPNLRDGISGIDLQPIPTESGRVSGYHVKDADDGIHCIDVLQMMYGWRLVLSDKRPGAKEHWLLDGAWCYFGTGTDEYGLLRTREQAFVNAVLAAQAWDGYGEPVGYNKVAGA